MARFVATLPNFGVDDTKWRNTKGVDEYVQWMMVPERGVNEVILQGGAGLDLRWKKDHIERIDEMTPKAAHVRRFRIFGKSHGRTVIHAVNNRGRAEAALNVSVKTKLVIGAAFHLVFHQQSRRATDVTLGVLTKIFDYANQILEPQANIVMIKQKAHWIEIQEDGVILNKVVAAENTWARFVQRYRDPTAEMNVFFMYELKAVLKENLTEDGKTFTEGGDVGICKAGHGNWKMYAHTLAHEVLHWCGMHNSDHEGESWSSIMGPYGNQIRWYMVEKVNP